MQEGAVLVNAQMDQRIVNVCNAYAFPLQIQAEERILITIVGAMCIETNGHKGITVNQQVEGRDKGIGMLLTSLYRAFGHGGGLVTVTEFPSTMVFQIWISD